MDYDISAKLKGLLKIWRHECIVHDDEKSVLVGYLCDCLYIGNCHKRICRALNDDTLHEGWDLERAMKLGSAFSNFNLRSVTTTEGAVPLKTMLEFLENCKYNPIPR